MQVTYQPEPVDTERIALPEELLPLLEMLARNTHENWARSRMEQGWTYGEARDDVKKQHPCLVPYEQLNEAEKEYDRTTSAQTLKLILALGFKITR